MKTSEVVYNVNELITTLVPEKTRNLEEALSKPDLDIFLRKANLGPDQLQYMRSNGLVQVMHHDDFTRLAGNLGEKREEYKKSERISKILKKDLFKKRLMYVFPYLFGNDSYRDYKRAEIGIAKGDLEEFVQAMKQIEEIFMKARPFAFTRAGVYAAPTQFCKEVYDVFYPGFYLQNKNSPLYDSEFSKVKEYWQRLGKTSQDKLTALNSINQVAAQTSKPLSHILGTYSELVDAIDGTAKDGLIWTAQGWRKGNFESWEANLSCALRTLFYSTQAQKICSVNYVPPKIESGMICPDNLYQKPNPCDFVFKGDVLVPGKLEVVAR